MSAVKVFGICERLVVETLRRFAKSIKEKVGRKRYLYLVAAVIGLLDSLAAVILKSSVHGAESAVRHIVGTTGYGVILSLFPIIGIGLTVIWVHFFIKEPISHGIGGVLEVIATPDAKMKPHNMFSSVVGCTLTAGFGGSVGMEGPIVATGAALGDNVASLSDADYKRRMILIGCGAAGAISAIFKAPFAGFVFCLEVFALDIGSSSVIALLISSAVACLSSMIVSGYQVEFTFALHDRFNPANAAFYAVLGILMAFVSVYFMRVSRLIERSCKKIRILPLRVLAGGATVGLLIAFFPALYGEGYLSMRSMLTDRMPDLFSGSIFAAFTQYSRFFPVLLIVLALIKPVAMALTTGSGGVGGVFAPTLFVGCAVGYAFAVICNYTGMTHLPPMNFALAGMAGAISGVMAAPLTGVFLVAELTGGYELFIPLIIVAAVSTIIARRFEPYSVYTRALGRSGRLITHHMDKAAITLLRIRELIDNACSRVRIDDDIATLSELFLRDPRPQYPVFDSSGQFAGFIRTQEVVSVVSDPVLRESLLVEDLLYLPQYRLDIAMESSLFFSAFDATGDECLPVFDGEHYIGIISSMSLYDAYRKKMAELSDGSDA